MALDRGGRQPGSRVGEWIVLAAALAILGAAVFSPGCASAGSKSAPPNAGLDALASDTAGRPIVRTDDLKPVESAPDINLSEVFDRAKPRPSRSTPAQTPSTEPVAIEHVPSPAPKPEAPKAPTETAREKVQRLTDELRAALVDRAGARPAFSDAAAGIALDAVAPDTAARSLATDLPPGQKRVLDAFRSVVRSLTEGPVDPRSAVGVFNAASASLDDSQSVQIRHAALCSKVTGFGRFEETGRSGFVAGRPIRFIVYTELERFGHRPAQSNDPGVPDFGGQRETRDLLAVELSQSLALWHDADGSAQWRLPEQTAVEVSRNKRRDFYLVQQVELPANLSVGKYNLKLTVHDRVTGAQDETSIPITLVADPSLTLGAGGK